MKWTPIDKVKVKFDCNYLVATPDKDPAVAKLEKSETTAAGVAHTFKTTAGDLVSATHVAILTDPSVPDFDKE